MFPHRGNIADLCNSLFSMGLNSETRYFVLWISSIGWIGQLTTIGNYGKIYTNNLHFRSLICTHAKSLPVITESPWTIPCFEIYSVHKDSKLDPTKLIKQKKVLKSLKIRQDILTLIPWSVIFVATSYRVCNYKSVSGRIFGLYSEHLSAAFRGIGFIRSQTRRSSTKSTIAEANISPDPFSSALVNDQLLIDWNVPAMLLSFHVEWTVRNYRKEDLFTMFCFFAPVTRNSVQAMCTMFSRKDFSRLFDGLLIIFTRKTNAEPRYVWLR